MIEVQIGTSNWMKLEEISNQWINDQIDKRRKDNMPICVKVRITTDTIKAVFVTPACGSRGKGRPPSPQEKELFDLWQKRGLQSNDFTSGDLISFLNQIKNHY